MLEDVLQPGLALVICGSAAGAVSAARGHYYAGPGNRFWPTLFEVGLTPRRLAPCEYRELPAFGIGLTDIAKGQSGSDSAIDFARSDPAELRRKLHRIAPDILAFNGRKAAQVFFGRSRVEMGLQPEMVGVTRLFVAPSTSGAASGYWDVGVWRELAKLVRGAGCAGASPDSGCATAVAGEGVILDEHFRKDAAIDFLKRVASGQVADAFERHVGPGFRHHNPHFRGDAASLREAMEQDAKRNPHRILEVQVALQDGEQVAVLSRIARKAGDPVWAVVHIFRFDGNHIVEMWDVGQAVPDDAVNEHGMF